MISDAEIKEKGIRILSEHLGDVEAERFITLMLREPQDYTKWRQEAMGAGTIDEISDEAMRLRNASGSNH
jgi:hypothetical protein